MWCILCCPRLSCNLTEMWDKERDISIQVLDLMETDFIEIFRVKTWLLLWLAKPAVGLVLDCDAATKLLHVEPSPTSPGPRLPVPALRSPARSFQYCAQTYTRSQHGPRRARENIRLRKKFKYIRIVHQSFWNKYRWSFCRAILFVSFHWWTRLVMWFD